MKVTQIVFSPTGGTQRVVDNITAEWGNHINKVDLTDARFDFSAMRFTRDDIVVIAVPSYGGRVPGLAADRLAKINGSQAQCVLVCAYGNRAYEDTLAELKDAAEHSGFHVIAAVSAIAEHSIMHQYASGRPDQIDKDELHGFARKILDKIGDCNADLISPLQVPGNCPNKKAAGMGLVPKANDKCVGCGLCAEKCPAQAISKESPKVTDSKKCISCMRCVALCPQSARKVNGAMVSIAALAIKKACSERKSNELYI